MFQKATGKCKLLKMVGFRHTSFRSTRGSWFADATIPRTNNNKQTNDLFSNWGVMRIYSLLEKHQIWLEFATVLRRIDVHVGKDITSTPRKQAVIEPPKPTAVALASWVDEKWMEIGGIQSASNWDIQESCLDVESYLEFLGPKGGIHGHPKKWSLWVELKWTSYLLVHVHRPRH